MSDPVVCSFLTKTLCAQGGRLGLTELREHIDLSEQQLVETLQAAGPRRFLLTGDDGLPAEVLAVSDVRVCVLKECQGCDRLHLCKLHLRGKCNLGPRACRYSHDISSAENKKVLKTHELSGLSEDELRVLLLQNDPFFLPDVCQFYNRRDGVCNQKNNCSRLHICRHYLQGKCKFFVCKRSHKLLDEHPRRVLETAGIDAKIVSNFQIIYDHKHVEFNKEQNKEKTKPHRHFRVYNYKRVETSRKKQADTNSEEQKLPLETTMGSGVHVPPSKDPSSNEPPQSQPQLPAGARGKEEGKKDDSSANTLKDKKEDNSDEICLFYVWKYCKHNDKCRSIHYHLPYRWQVFNGFTWNDLSMMEEIEKAYCDPKMNSTADKNINFQTMTCSSSLLRRLSTPSSVTQPMFVLTTKWIWYWQNDQGQWIEYGEQAKGDVVNSPSSDILENLYLADPDAIVPFQAGLYGYQLNFKEMTQTNISSKTRRRVCRRPKFVSYEEVQKIKQSSQRDSSIPNQACPPHWDSFALPDSKYKAVEISNISSEYKEIKKQFEQTMKTYNIVRVQRIQNPSLWKVFQWKKEQMKKEAGKKEVNERLLFHGTKGARLEDICINNFDWRTCGSNGANYGKGSYFARDASYSHEYCQSTVKPNVMFMARVLVGDYVQGRADYVRPPTRSADGLWFYDSCVDNELNPSIFVIFEKNQIYPEYLIEYKEAEKKCIIS
ncbi:protein mono-ADP-ribosyltransferase PARP12 isoform X2 [Anser cygnoides]|uniref:protein mono-ADP-ribosyltransferase PARP12 isoform X2 n=1 Tax=Anser cygnoides TaxID=8845 RepID=UPI0034D33519